MASETKDEIGRNDPRNLRVCVAVSMSSNNFINLLKATAHFWEKYNPSQKNLIELSSRLQASTSSYSTFGGYVNQDKSLPFGLDVNFVLLDSKVGLDSNVNGPLLACYHTSGIWSDRNEIRKTVLLLFPNCKEFMDEYNALSAATLFVRLAAKPTSTC